MAQSQASPLAIAMAAAKADPGARPDRIIGEWTSKLAAASARWSFSIPPAPIRERLRMWPLAGLVGVVVGAVAGAAGAVVYGPQLAHQGRPAAKAALKAALHAIHEARVRGAVLAEAAEDLYAEAKAEVTEEVIAAVMAAAKAKAEEAAAEPEHAESKPASAHEPVPGPSHD